MPFANSSSGTAMLKEYFKKKRIPYTQEALVRVLEDDASPKNAVYCAVLGLRDVGTAKCIPALKMQLRYPMRDVQDCSILTIAHIAGAAETDFYVHALQDKKTQKSYPMWAILATRTTGARFTS